MVGCTGEVCSSCVYPVSFPFLGNGSWSDFVCSGSMSSD